MMMIIVIITICHEAKDYGRLLLCRNCRNLACQVGTLHLRYLRILLSKMGPPGALVFQVYVLVCVSSCLFMYVYVNVCMHIFMSLHMCVSPPRRSNVEFMALEEVWRYSR